VVGLKLFRVTRTRRFRYKSITFPDELRCTRTGARLAQMFTSLSSSYRSLPDVTVFSRPFLEQLYYLFHVERTTFIDDNYDNNCYDGRYRFNHTVNIKDKRVNYVFKYICRKYV